MTPSTATATVELTMIELDKLAPHPDNVRRRLGDLTEITKSIDGSGILEPLLVLPAGDDGTHQVVAGHRRLAAAHKAKTYKGPAPCVIRDLTPVEVLETMLTENLQRAEITPIEEARAYARLVELDTTVAEIARKVGRSQPLVKSRLALMVLPAEVLDLVEAGKLTLGDAEELTKWADDDDAMAWLVDLLKDRGHGNPAYAVQQYISERDRKREIDAIAAKLEAKGITRYVPKDRWWQPPWDLALSKPSKLKETGLTVTQHRSEPCHAVFISNGGYSGSKIEQIPLCTKPKRHTDKGTGGDRSDLQMDKARYEKSVDDAAAERKAEEKARNAATARHRSATAKPLDTLTKIDDDIVSMALHALDSRVGYDRQVRITACELLQLPSTPSPAGGVDQADGWDAFIADPDNHPRALTALAAATCLRQNYDWSNPTYTALLEFVLHRGYQPADDTEAELVERALEQRMQETTALAAGLDDAGIDELYQLQARSAELDDGPELDQVNARIAELLAGDTGGELDEVDVDEDEEA